MKKVLSVILAIMMIATCTPMVFAEGECNHSFDDREAITNGYAYCSKCEVKSANFSEFYEAFVGLYGLCYSVGYYGDNEKSFRDCVVGFLQSAGSRIGSIYKATENEQKAVDKAAEEINTFIKEIKENSTIIYDGTEFMRLYFAITFIPAEKDALAMELFSEELILRIDEAVVDFIQGVENHNYGDENAEELKLKGETAIYYMKSVMDCLNGNHRLGDCSDNGDGTHSADCMFCITKNVAFEHEWGEYVRLEDGSKVAECKYCEATDVDSFEKDILDFIRMLVELIKSFIEAMSA